MPRDYANRPTSKRSNKRRSEQRRPLLHGPSLLLGIVLGAGGLAMLVWGPSLLPEPTPSASADGEQQTPTVTFEFPDLLRESEIETTDSPPMVEGATASVRVQLQAGSFRDPSDADRMRARLLLLDLPVDTTVARLEDGDWHRVMVGPFQRRVDAQRAMTTLREQNVTAIWIEQ